MDAEDRNLISGNITGGSSPNIGSDNWTYQGNYIGVAADGITALPNAQPGGSGALSLDNSNGHVVGGSEPTAINVISGNLGHGIAPHNSDNILIEGNYIGLAYDGTTLLGNRLTGAGSGLALSDTEGATIRDNRIADWENGGIWLNPVNSDATIENNTVYSNQGLGIGINDASNITLTSNEVYDNTEQGISLQSTQTAELSGNTIHSNNSNGIQVEGSNITITGNTVHDNAQYGIGSEGDDATITGNTVYDNTQQGIFIASGSQAAEISTNEVYNNSNHGIDSQGDSTTITGNIIYDNTQYGINIVGTSNVASDNTVYDNTQYGINIVGTSNVASDNTVYDNTQDGIYVTATSTDNSVSENTVYQNGQVGIRTEGDTTDITNNTVRDNTEAGIFVATDAQTTNVMGNTVRSNSAEGIAVNETSIVDIVDNIVENNQANGIDVSDSSDVTISENTVFENAAIGIMLGGTDGLVTGVEVEGNTIYSNGFVNIMIFGVNAFGLQVDGIAIRGNKIGLLPNGQPAPTNPIGIVVQGDPANLVIGGTDSSDGNTITSSSGPGVALASLTVEVMSTTISPKVSVIGNNIVNSSPGVMSGFESGIGIDLLNGIDTDASPDGVANTFADTGPTLNDTSDADTGANGYINFPVLNTVHQGGEQATINFNLDAADSPVDQYRVEFFANDTADPSGYGEGQTFLGAATVGNGDNQQATITLPTGTDLTGKSISATTTAIDATTDSGFGGTSEFSLAVAATVENDDSSGSLASTGQNSLLILLTTIIGIITSSLYLGLRVTSGSSNFS